jgi:folate-binding protein YgfZ
MSNDLDISYFTLNDYCTLEITGKRCLEFIQGQASGDISEKTQNKDVLFCDEKGFVITNATVVNSETLEVIIKNDVAEILKRELEKYSKLYKCEIIIKETIISGIYDGMGFTKTTSMPKASNTNNNWDLLKLLNFDIDISNTMSLKNRPNEFGYSLDKYVSFTKGCYRGQEIIARLKYLGSKKSTLAIFKDLTADEKNQLLKIGKEVFEIELDNIVYRQYIFKSFENVDALLNSKLVASQSV